MTSIYRIPHSVWIIFYYRDNLDRVLRDPLGLQLAQIHNVFQIALHYYLKKDLCSPQPGDNNYIFEYKTATADRFDRCQNT
jgi:hypothetical protein